MAFALLCFCGHTQGLLHLDLQPSFSCLVWGLERTVRRGAGHKSFPRALGTRRRWSVPALAVVVHARRSVPDAASANHRACTNSEVLRAVHSVLVNTKGNKLCVGRQRERRRRTRRKLLPEAPHRVHERGSGCAGCEAWCALRPLPSWGHCEQSWETTLVRAHTALRACVEEHPCVAHINQGRLVRARIRHLRPCSKVPVRQRCWKQAQVCWWVLQTCTGHDCRCADVWPGRVACRGQELEVDREGCRDSIHPRPCRSRPLHTHYCICCCVAECHKRRQHEALLQKRHPNSVKCKVRCTRYLRGGICGWASWTNVALNIGEKSGREMHKKSAPLTATK